MTRLAIHAMGCRFEVALHGDSPSRLYSAGQEALQEVERLEAMLSLFVPTSEVSGLNARASRQPVLVSPELFRILEQCRALHEATEGAFDVTVGPLMALWGFRGDEGVLPSDEEVAAVLGHVGLHYVELDAGARTVRFLREKMSLDLGGIGKGYALECAADVLREAGVTSALLHAGTSSVYALGAPPDTDAWPIGLPDPRDPDAPARVLPLRDEGLSVSAVHGQGFVVDGQYYGHVMDPRTGRPTQGALLTTVTHPSPTIAEGLSTGLLVLGDAGLARVREAYPQAEGFVIEGESGGMINVQ